MASPTQTVVGKGEPNPLTAEGLLKILRKVFIIIIEVIKSLHNYY
jgi:hypothetical protein